MNSSAIRSPTTSTRRRRSASTSASRRSAIGGQRGRSSVHRAQRFAAASRENPARGVDQIVDDRVGLTAVPAARLRRRRRSRSAPARRARRPRAPSRRRATCRRRRTTARGRGRDRGAALDQARRRLAAVARDAVAGRRRRPDGADSSNTRRCARRLRAQQRVEVRDAPRPRTPRRRSRARRPTGW